MGNDALTDVAEDIASKLARQLAHPRLARPRDSAEISDLVLQGLARKVVELMNEGGVSDESPESELEVRFRKIEKKLNRLMTALTITGEVEIGDEGDVSENGRRDDSFSSIKYAKSKYGNVGALLNYVESLAVRMDVWLTYQDIIQKGSSLT